MSIELSIEMLDPKIKQGTLAAAAKAISKSKGNGRKKGMLWQDEKCKEAVGNRNKALRHTQFVTFDSVQECSGSTVKNNKTGKNNL